MLCGMLGGMRGDPPPCPSVPARSVALELTHLPPTLLHTPAHPHRGDWLPEAKYGMQFNDKPFAGKAIFRAPSFSDAEVSLARPFRAKYLEVLVVDCGGGVFVEEEGKADLVIKGDSDAR